MYICVHLIFAYLTVFLTESTPEEHKMKVEEDSDDSSLPSLEDEEEKGKKEEKQKSVTKKKRSEERENTPRGKARSHNTQTPLHSTFQTRFKLNHSPNEL